MYFPKSQIKTNLFTNGGEYEIKSTGEEYRGDYFLISTGKMYTGKTPQSPNVVEIIEKHKTQNSPVNGSPYSDNNPPISMNIIDDGYYSSKDLPLSNPSPTYPTQTNPHPTSKDYNLGEFSRYFVCKVNGSEVLEITRDEYDRYIQKDNNVPYQLYKPITLSWVLSGDRNKVYSMNEYVVTQSGKNSRCLYFKSYFRNRYTQFWKESGVA